VSIIDLTFVLQGTTIPLDYGYALFGAISRIIPAIHGDRRVGVHPIRGMKLQPGRLTLVPQSRLRLRLPSEEIGPYLPLAGAKLDLDGSVLRIGVPRTEALVPAPVLNSRLVTIGHRMEPEEFLASANRQLTEMGVQARAEFLPSPDPRYAGQPSRRVLVVKGRKVVGYPIVVAGLDAAESVRLQELGLGSRRRMGCGVFVRKGDLTNG
jgi:CRISPR-associated protein Cas6